jgi:hypothetical protein
MNLSKETLTLIKNFSSINGSIMFQKGNKLATISEGRNVMASVSIAEEFPIDFGIYDLGEFLNAVSIFSNPQLEFFDKYILISDGDNSKIKYFGAGEGIVKAPPSTIKFPVPEIMFHLDAHQLAMIIRTASVLKTNDIAIVGTGSEIKIIVSDKKNATANAYDVVIEENSNVFNANFKLDNLKCLMPGAYTVEISSKKISRFKNVNDDLTYFIAIEADSTFNE